MKLTLTKSLVLTISPYQHLTYLDHSLTFLEPQLAYLPVQLKQDGDARLKGAAIARQNLMTKTHSHSFSPSDEQLPITNTGKRVTRSDKCLGLPVASVVQSVTCSAHGGSACSQSAQCRSARCSHSATVIPQLQPDLNALVWTLTPELFGMCTSESRSAERYQNK